MTVRSARVKVTSMGPDARKMAHGHIAGGNRGMTLVELMAAMVILLVGVYSVAALFPRMTRNLVNEERRTAMSRAVDREAESLQRSLDGLPAETAPSVANANVVDIATNKPEDPDDSATGANSRDDFVWAISEEFTVPAAASGGGSPCYVPRMGLINPGPGSLLSYEVYDLVRTTEDPAGGTAVPQGHYFLRQSAVGGPDSIGELVVNPPAGYAAASASVDYEWTDAADGLVKRAVEERVDLMAPGPHYVQVNAPGVGRAGSREGYPRSANSRAQAVRLWPATMGDLGHALYFPASAAGRKMRINYQLRLENGRRQLIMQEDKAIPAETPYQIALNFGHLDDETPLMETNFSGAPISPVYVIVVDLTDGTRFVWDESQGGQGIENVDAVRGLINFDSAAISGRLGNPVRIYYRTLDQHFVQAQKAPSSFVEWDGVTTPASFDWALRTYRIGNGAAFTGSPDHACIYAMPAYCEDHAVQVDYLVADPAGTGLPPVRVRNETHVIADLGLNGGGTNLGYGFVLDRPDVLGVLAVRGVSMRVCGWYRTEGGSLSRVDETRVLFPGV
jgi:prepilin-type N-terminal cleavage/methylation domain-containing protein